MVVLFFSPADLLLVLGQNQAIDADDGVVVGQFSLLDRFIAGIFDFGIFILILLVLLEKGQKVGLA